MADHTLGKSNSIQLDDGRALHYRSRGSGEPTVVFEAGMGFSSATWGMVQPAVADRTLAVTYDRAGTGKSTWDSADRSIDRICDDLGQLLSHLPGPFILVGHSWGGTIVRRMAARRTADIRALVLVDQSDERDPDYFTEAKTQNNGFAKTMVLWKMHTDGLRSAGLRMLRGMPTDCRREIMWRDISIRGLKASDAERAHFLPGLQLMLDADDRLSGIDVSVITGSSQDEMDDEYRPPLVRAHRETANALEKGSLVEAGKSGHFIPMSEPKVVANEILKHIDRFRTAKENDD